MLLSIVMPNDNCASVRFTTTGAGTCIGTVTGTGTSTGTVATVWIELLYCIELIPNANSATRRVHVAARGETAAVVAIGCLSCVALR